MQTPRDIGATPQNTPPQKPAQQETPAVPSSSIGSAGQLSTCCDKYDSERNEKRRSTGEKRVTIKADDSASVQKLDCEAAHITSVKDSPHEDTPREDPDASALKPYADDASLLSPVLEEALDLDNPRKTSADSPAAGNHHHHVSIAEPTPASKPTSMAGSNAEVHSTAGHAAARSNYSIASNMSGTFLQNYGQLGCHAVY